MAEANALLAEAPAQFQVWGSAGPDLRPVPSGWTSSAPASQPQAALTPTPAERQRGFILFAADPFAMAESLSVPPGTQRAAHLRAFATPGEYEPVAVALVALENLRAVKVAVSDLRSPAGAVIPPEAIDVRVSRAVPMVVNPARKTYREEPFLLEKRSSFSLAKGESKVVWVTLGVPSDAAPGDYVGSLTVGDAGSPPAKVDLLLRILPFALPAAPVELTMYYPVPSDSDDMLHRELTDLREHGASVPLPCLEVRVKSRDQKFGPDDEAETAAYSQRLLAAVRKVYGGFRFPATFQVGHQIAFYWEPTKNWFAYWKHSPEIENDFGRAIELIQRIAASNNIPALRAYITDEGGAHNLLDEAVYYNRWVKEHFPRIATTASIGGGIALGFDEIGQLSEAVDFLTVNRFTPEVAGTLVARKKPYGIYNGAGGTPAGARFFFGFYGYKTGASQVGQWSYSFGESVFKGNGLRQPDEGYVYHAADGPLPSFMWEAVREGIDDARYLELLRQMIAAGRSSPQAPARAAAEQARATLSALLARIGWGFQPVQSDDHMPPPRPATLGRWRWQVAEQILALQKTVGSTPGQVDAPRPSPLQWQWAEPRVETAKHGPELLPNADFESGMKPWRVDAWTGHGKGELDSTERHGGSQSVRVESPEADGNSAVTVLVWPQYGDDKINLSLGGGRTYEFSAWVKLKTPRQPPQLRVNLPGDSVDATRSGHSAPTPDGWQKLWVRTQVRSTARPVYLAVWLQGPGVIWVDDLSLREVVPQPSPDPGEPDE